MTPPTFNCPEPGCPEAGAWRAWLDQHDQYHPAVADRVASASDHDLPATDRLAADRLAADRLASDRLVADRLGAHLAGCLACQRMVSGLRAARAEVDASLAGLGPSVVPTSSEVAQARVRLAAARAVAPAAEGGPSRVAAEGARFRVAGARGVVAGIAAEGGQSRAAAEGRQWVEVAGEGGRFRVAGEGCQSVEVAGEGRQSAEMADGGRGRGAVEHGVAVDERAQETIDVGRKTVMWRGWRVAVSGVAAAVVLSLAVAFTPGGQSAASAFLSQFRTQTVAPIAVSARSQAELIRTMNALGRLGTVSLPNGERRPEAVPRGLAQQARTVSLAEASQAVGFGLLVPDPKTLPAQVSPTPTVQVVPGQSIQFTFDKARAGAYLSSIGRSDVVVPDRFDGATLAVTIPSVALLQYGDPSSRGTLVVGEAGEVTVDVVRGSVGLDELRTFLLSLPGLPSDVVTQLSEISNWSNTLPVPVPVDVATWQRVSIRGNTGLLLNDNSGLGSAAIWHADGHLYGVAGSIRATDLRHISNNLVPAS